jgi:hypothetical protein
VSGCSYSYLFDLSLTVVNDADGAPLEGVRVTLEFQPGLRDGRQPPQATDPDGRFVHNFSVSITEFDAHNQRRWWVKLEKDGFAPETIDIKPATKPAKYGSTTPLNVTVRLKPN